MKDSFVCPICGKTALDIIKQHGKEHIDEVNP